MKLIVKDQAINENKNQISKFMTWVSSMLWPISYDGIIKKGYIFFFGKIGICIEIK